MASVRDLSGNAPFTTPDKPISEVTGISRSYAVTPSDTIDLPNGITTALSVQTAGNVKVTYANGDTDEVYLLAGQWHLMEVKRVWSTTAGTIAENISAGYAQ